MLSHAGATMSCLHDRPDHDWLIDGSNLRDNASVELQDAVFSLSNGVFGCRGSRPFSPRGTPGTYINGVYASGPADMTYIPPVGHIARDAQRFPEDKEIHEIGIEWVLPTAPNLFFMEHGVAGAAVAADALSPVLDLRNGALSFEGGVSLGDESWRYRNTRFVSRHDAALACERIELVPARVDQELDLFIGIDDTYARCRDGKKFVLWKQRRFTAGTGDMVSWQGITAGKQMQVGISYACRAPGASVCAEERDGLAGLHVTGRGAQVVDRYVSVASSVFHKDPLAVSREHCARASQRDMQEHLADHSRALGTLWDACDVRIDGPLSDQQMVRYNIFHIISSVVDTDRLSIGAKFLSHCGYKAGVFWDMDIYVLPYLIRALPHYARRHEEFRYHGLAGARAKAALQGYNGAMYPWTTLPGGVEGIEPWIIFDRTEVHIVADVAWGVVEYYTWTGDERFMETMGWEILAGCARFWMSRIDQAEGSIKEICGPDECNSCVDNNAFTNLMVRHTLDQAARFAGGHVDNEEIAAWRDAAARLVQKKPGPDGLVEQFDNYFGNPEVNDAKQADVLVIPQLFPDYLTDAQIAANYDYYEPRTTHKSSLSEGSYALAAARLGMRDQAYDFFRRAALMDLHDVHEDTTGGGLHSACMGSVLTAILSGFCGIRLENDAVVYKAQLPKKWKAISVTLVHRGKKHRLDLRDEDSGRLA
ncbi:MAG: hypothetical protein GF418_03630 [Chitinivibrionales bacterium]|nr:hypothetical protein [Chitinivibrionales bacterium]MBD3394695.1 hypothetical protein [Chitinivibrionales bacterium]